MRTSLLYLLCLLSPAAAWAEPGGPVQRRDIVQHDMSERAEQARDRAIEMLKGVADSDLSDARRPEILLRLGDLLAQRGHAEFMKHMEACSEEACANDESAWRQPMERALRLFRIVHTNYPRYERADEALWHEAMALQQLGQTQEEVQTLRALVRAPPDSSRAGDAYLLIGEHHFSNNHANNALVAYTRAAADHRTTQRDHARYMAAWCHYNLGQIDPAINGMRQLARTHSKPGGDPHLLSATLRDLVRFYADTDRVDDAIAELTTLGRPDLVRTTLAQSAVALDKRGAFEASAHTRRVLLARDPMAIDNPAHQAEIVRSARHRGDMQDELNELTKLRSTYGNNSSWARTHRATPSVVADASKTIETELRFSAVAWHTQARKLGKTEQARSLSDAAQRTYDTWLSDNPTATDAAEMHYAYVELLYGLQDYAGAYNHYTAVVHADPDGPRARFSAESAIHAADQLVQRQPQPGEHRLTTAEHALVDACALFATHYDGPQVQAVTYKAAYLLYTRSHYDAAMRGFNDAIQLDPATATAEQAAHLSMDLLSQQRRWADLVDLASRYASNERLGREVFRAEAQKIQRRAAFQAIQGLEPGQHAERARAYERWANRYGRHADATEHAIALHNAAVHFHEALSTDDATRMRLLLVRNKKLRDSPHVFAELLRLGLDRERIADFAGAVEWYQQGIRQADRTTAPLADRNMLADAVFRTGVVLRALDRHAEARPLFARFAQSEGHDPGVLLSLRHVAEIDTALDTDPTAAWNAVLNHQDASIAQQAHAALQLGAARDARGEDPSAFYASVVKRLSTSDDPQALVAVAQMRFLRQPSTEVQFEGMRISSLGQGSPRSRENAHQKQQIAAIMQALADQERHTSEVVATRSGRWSLASIVRLGEAHERVAQILAQAEVPWYLGSEQARMYRAGLRDQSDMHREKAVDLYSTALGKAHELVAYDSHTERAFARLSTLRPEDFQALHEDIPKPSYLASPRTAVRPELDL